MKYDGYEIAESESYPNNNIERRTRKRYKIGLLDVFIAQAIICVAVSCGFMITRMIGMGL